MSPSTGSTRGGTPIVVRGAFFSARGGVPDVIIGGNAASDVVFVSASELSAVAPAGAAGPANVVVRCHLGDGVDVEGSAANAFFFVAPAGDPPVIDAIDPQTGTVDGGDDVVISGSGFVAGDRRFLKAFLDLRSVAAPQVPVPAQEVAIAAYNDESHVEENRALYRAKFDLADQIIGNRYGYKRPPGGFFLWLDVSQHGGSEGATVKLWKEAGLRVLPGAYAARPQADGTSSWR